MSQEILYTSAPKLLKLGMSGYGTVVSTQGMLPPLADRLEQLSGYRWAFDLGDPRCNDNPVNHSHVTIVVAGQRYHVLSRISNYPADYSGRSNKIAHHVALLESELPAGGPAWVLMSPGFCEAQWDGHLRTLPTGRKPTFTTRSTADYSLWKHVTGDAGWAGVLAETALQEERRPVHVIFPLGTNTLALVEQALNLLPHRERWKVTFSTYYTGLPASVDCLWQFVLDGTPEAAQLRRNPHQRVIDLASTLGPATGGPLVQEAREGRQPPLMSTPPTTPTAPVRVSAAAAAVPRTVPAPSPFSEVPPPPPTRSPDVPSESHRPGTRRGISLLAASAIALLFGAVTGIGGYFLGQSGWPNKPVPDGIARAPEKSTRPAKEDQQTSDIAKDDAPTQSTPKREITKAAPTPSPPASDSQSVPEGSPSSEGNKDLAPLTSTGTTKSEEGMPVDKSKPDKKAVKALSPDESSKGSLLKPHGESHADLEKLNSLGANICGIVRRALLVGDADQGRLKFADVSSEGQLTLSLAVPSVDGKAAKGFESVSLKPGPGRLNVLSNEKLVVTFEQKERELFSVFPEGAPRTRLGECALLVRSHLEGPWEVYLLGEPNRNETTESALFDFKENPPFRSHEDTGTTPVQWGKWQFLEGDRIADSPLHSPLPAAKLFSSVNLPIARSAPGGDQFWPSEVWRDDSEKKVLEGLRKRMSIRLRTAIPPEKNETEAIAWHGRLNPSLYFECNASRDGDKPSWKSHGSNDLKKPFQDADNECAKKKAEIVAQLASFTQERSNAESMTDAEQKANAIKGIDDKKSRYIEEVVPKIVEAEILRRLKTSLDQTAAFIKEHPLKWQLWTEFSEVGAKTTFNVNLGTMQISAKK